MKESWERAEKSAKTVLRQWQCWEIAERELRDCWETAVKTACKSEQELWRLILRIQKYHTHTQTQTDRHTNRVTSWAPGRSQNIYLNTTFLTCWGNNSPKYIQSNQWQWLDRPMSWGILWLSPDQDKYKYKRALSWPNLVFINVNPIMIKNKRSLNERWNVENGQWHK